MNNDKLKLIGAEIKKEIDKGNIVGASIGWY